MTKEEFYRLLYFILDSHVEDMDCNRCNSQMAYLAEQVAQGADMHALWPAVEVHLECCADCREEFNALLAIVRAEKSGQIPDEPA
jgi:anti-sigma factor ChrR (cupin superfamily)